MHRHKLRPVMKALEEEERRARMAEVEVEVVGSLEEEFSMTCGLGNENENGNGFQLWPDEGTNEVGQTTWERRHADQTEWMGIRMAGKGRGKAGFW